MDTATQEFKELIERNEKRRADWLEKGLKTLAEEKPGLEIDPKKATLTDRLDLRYQIDAYGYYEVGTYGIYEGMTDLAWAIDSAKKYDGSYQLYETKYAIYVISSWNWIYTGATVQKFYKPKGNRAKGVRRQRAIHETTKGKYIELDGVRVYQDTQGAQ